MTARASRAVSVGVAAFGVAAGAAAAGLGLGTLANPGPGLWPLAASALITGSALVGVVTGGTAGAEPFTRETRRVLVAVAGIGGFALVFPATGLVLPGILLLLLWLRVLAAEPWRIVLPLAVALPAVLAVVFRTLLRVPLPPDLLLGDLLLSGIFLTAGWG